MILLCTLDYTNQLMSAVLCNLDNIPYVVVYLKFRGDLHTHVHTHIHTHTHKGNMLN